MIKEELGFGEKKQNSNGKDKKNNEENIGVVLCECGGEISKNIDLNKVIEVISGLGYRVLRNNMLCTPENLDAFSEELFGLSRVVFAVCTPKRIENTMKKLAEEAGIHPYLIQIVNMREQCAWVCEDNDAATQKAISLIKAALDRVKLHEPIHEKSVEVNTDVVVIGAGVAGTLSALTLSEDRRRTVHLFEKSSWLGGRILNYENLAPDFTCAQCLMSSPLQTVLERENIVLHTKAEVIGSKGGLGNFLVEVSEAPRCVEVEKCIGCGECINACPVKDSEEGKPAIWMEPGSLPNAPSVDSERCLYGQGCRECLNACIFEAINFKEFGKERRYNIRCGSVILSTGSGEFPFEPPSGITHGVYTASQFEQILLKNGPTGGKVLDLKTGDEPNSVAIIHCVGRDELGYCSTVCCSVALKYTHLIREQLPECEIHHIYRDIVLPPDHQRLIDDVMGDTSVHFHRLGTIDGDERAGNYLLKGIGNKIQIELGINGSENGDKEIEADLVVLMCGITPQTGLKKLSRIFDLNLDERGFIKVMDVQLDPVESKPGILVAGCAAGPCSVGEASRQAMACAGKVLSTLIPGQEVSLEPKVAVVDKDRCSGCKACVVCPYGAISFEDGNEARIDENFCKGCGICASVCPSKAITPLGYTSPQIKAEIRGLLESVEFSEPPTESEIHLTNGFGGFEANPEGYEAKTTSESKKEKEKRSVDLKKLEIFK